MTKLTELIENATREELAEVLLKISEQVESHEEVNWETTCPERLIGNYDDAWDAGQDNGESYMANHIEGIIRSSFNMFSDSQRLQLQYIPQTSTS